MHFSKLRDKRKLCIIWISSFAYGYLFDSEEIHTVNVPMNEISLSEQNHFKWDDTSIAKISYQHRGHNMAKSS